MPLESYVDICHQLLLVLLFRQWPLCISCFTIQIVASRNVYLILLLLILHYYSAPNSFLAVFFIQLLIVCRFCPTLPFLPFTIVNLLLMPLLFIPLLLFTFFQFFSSSLSFLLFFALLLIAALCPDNDSHFCGICNFVTMLLLLLFG